MQKDKAPTEISSGYADYADVFLFDLAMKLPVNTGINEHDIELVEGKQPPYGSIYSLSPVELEILKTYIETHLKTGFFRPSKSPAGAPIFFNKKPDGSLCLCVNYRGLNYLTIKNQYPLLLIGESLDWLGWAKRFTQLDLTSAYHRMRIWEGDEWKTAFRTRYGHFEYQVMPFGLSNTPASFQGYINKILAKKLDIFVIVYLDDILIYTEDLGQPHLDAVRWVLEQFRKHGFFANLKKSRFHQDKVWLLGFVVSSQGIRMEEERIEEVKAWVEPKSVRDIQVVLGFANFYRRIIKGFSKIAAPLTSMLRTTAASPKGPQETTGKVRKEATGKTREETGSEVESGGIKIGGVELVKGKKLKNLAKAKTLKFLKVTLPGTAPEARLFLTPKARLAFTRLRQAFTEAPILHHFDPERHIRIETDASGYAIGGMFSQLTSDHFPSESYENFSSKSSDVGQWHPVAFFSRKMIPTETRYETHNQELLAIVEIFKTWRHYLEGWKYEVLVLTDYNNLRRFMDTKSLSSKQARWAQELSRYHFWIDYCQGKVNAAADALSRFPQRSQAEEKTLRAENSQIFHRLRSSLTNASLVGLSLSGHTKGTNLSPLHQVFICGTYVLPWLCQFWKRLCRELASEGAYQASVGGICLRLPELQAEDQLAGRVKE